MKQSLKSVYDVERFRTAGHAVIDQLADHLAKCFAGDNPRTLPWKAPADSVATWQAFLDSPTQSVQMMCGELVRNSIQLNDPRYLGHQIGCPAPNAVLVGLVVDFLNNGSGVYEMGMSAVAMERLLMRRLADVFRFDEKAGGFFTSGGTLANLTALLAARARYFRQTEGGRPPRLAVMVSEQAHYCIQRAAHVMGWDEEATIKVPVDESFRMRADLLPQLFAAAVDRGLNPIAIVGSSCTTSTGSFDPLRSIGQFAAARKLWFHVDAAHGGAVAFSESHRSLLDGIELADSVTIDFHKLMMTPALCSGLVFRKSEDSYDTFSLEADYLFAKRQPADERDEFNLARRTFECTKSMMAAKAFSIWAVHGPDAWGDNVDHLHALASQLAQMIASNPRFELMCSPQTNIVCFRICAPDSQADATNSQVLALRDAVCRESPFYIVSTTLNGKTCLRCTVANPFTTEEHMATLLSVVHEHAKTLGI